MKKSISILLAVVCLVLCFSGCGNINNKDVKTHKAYTFTVDTRDKIRIELDTTDGYDLTSNLPFEISADSKILSQGTFIEADKYEQYVSIVNSDTNASLIDSGTKGSNKYIFWSYNNSEYDIAILIGDSHTGILLGNTTSEESARECFERLTISVED